MLIQNTLGISVYSLLVGFPAPILLALVLNEQKSRKLKRIVQTVSYAPHFISTVVMVSLLMIILRSDYGILNKLLGLLGVPSQDYLSNPNLFKSIYVFSGIWQSAGWGSIIYLASLAGVDPELHEAAMIDGASRLERIWYINLPGILPTIVIMFIITAGNLMSVGFEKAFLMQNPLNLEASEVISTYIYKVGLMQVRYSFSSAVGLFNSVINCILLVAVNTFSRRLGDTSLW
jgi:putative aldouronate transport system permease protein